MSESRAAIASSPAGEATMQRALTSIVIVTANSGAGIGDCVAHALASLSEVEIVVVDNASVDGSIEALRANCAAEPRVRIESNVENTGFGPACNRGATFARGDALLFLNPDCMIEPETIPALRRILDDSARIGLVGALQVGTSGAVDAASRRHDPLLRRALMSATGLARFASRWPFFEGVNLAPADAVRDGEVERVDAVSGALMLVRNAVFERVRGFDEGYFLHFEDLDLCRRVRDAGYDVVCANRVRVRHAKGGSSWRRPFRVAWHKHRGMWRWFVKFDPAARNPLTRALVLCGIWAMFALRLPLLLARRLLRARTP